MADDRSIFDASTKQGLRMFSGIHLTEKTGKQRFGKAILDSGPDPSFVKF